MHCACPLRRRGRCCTSIFDGLHKANEAASFWQHERRHVVRELPGLCACRCGSTHPKSVCIGRELWILRIRWNLGWIYILFHAICRNSYIMRAQTIWACTVLRSGHVVLLLCYIRDVHAVVNANLALTDIRAHGCTHIMIVSIKHVHNHWAGECHYTSDPAEIARMERDGWIRENIKWYCD